MLYRVGVAQILSYRLIIPNRALRLSWGSFCIGELTTMAGRRIRYVCSSAASRLASSMIIMCVYSAPCIFSFAGLSPLFHKVLLQLSIFVTLPHLTCSTQRSSARQTDLLRRPRLGCLCRRCGSRQCLCSLHHYPRRVQRTEI